MKRGIVVDVHLQGDVVEVQSHRPARWVKRYGEIDEHLPCGSVVDRHLNRLRVEQFDPKAQFRRRRAEVGFGLHLHDEETFAPRFLNRQPRIAVFQELYRRCVEEKPLSILTQPRNCLSQPALFLHGMFNFCISGGQVLRITIVRKRVKGKRLLPYNSS